MLVLHPHPTTPCFAVDVLQVTAEWTEEGGLRLQYRLTGNLAQIRIPAPQPPAFTDGLWEHTCFEAFIRVQGESGYHEFNFSPSGQWAAYAFSGYRKMEERGEFGRESDSSNGVVPRFPLCKRGIEGDFLLETLVPAQDLPVNPDNKSYEFALTAVIETTTGEKSYWALKHAAEKPDFHHPDSFTVSL